MKPQCPACFKFIDAYTQVNGRELPRIGDFSICFYCGVVLVFTSINPLEYRQATEQEQQEFDEHIDGPLAKQIIQLRQTRQN